MESKKRACTSIKKSLNTHIICICVQVEVKVVAWQGKDDESFLATLITAYDTLSTPLAAPMRNHNCQVSFYVFVFVFA